ncbi:hypothetical protein BC628DRAFT_1040380 [Trametes gibbosa]|nr:hypothetical protein BC628DRAFT_1040380 [Trametes gibbosa]
MLRHLRSSPRQVGLSRGSTASPSPFRLFPQTPPPRAPLSCALRHPANNTHTHLPPSLVLLTAPWRGPRAPRRSHRQELRTDRARA